MTYTKNIMMVLIAVFMVIACAMPVMATDGNETFDSSTIVEDIVTPEITPEPTQTPEGVWHNDNYYTYENYLKMIDGANVVYNSKTDVASKIRDTTPVVPDYSKQGNVIFMIRAGGSAQDLNVWVKDVTNTTIPAFDHTYNPDKSMIDGQNIGYDRYEIMMNGESDLLPFPAGKYVAYIQNGNGGQPEVQEFIVGNGATTRVAFLGHAVSCSESCTPHYTILDATYGLGHTTCNDVIHHHGDYNRVWVNGHCNRYWHGMCVDWVNAHYEYVNVGHNNGDYDKNCNRGRCNYEYVAPTVEHQCQTDGEVISVTSEVQQAVNSGHTAFFFFDNAQTPGGIFGFGNELLVEIEDPAQGYVKNVRIEYENGCGIHKIIETQEYCNINLVNGVATCPSV